MQRSRVLPSLGGSRAVMTILKKKTSVLVERGFPYSLMKLSWEKLNNACCHQAKKSTFVQFVQIAFSLETYLLYSGKYFNLSRECWWHFATAQNLQLAITQLAITYNKFLRPPLFVSRVDKLKACLSTLSLLHFNYL